MNSPALLGQLPQPSWYNQDDFQMSKLSPDWRRTSVLEAVFDQLSDALVLYSPDFTITGVNRAAEKLFGMGSEDMVGKHCQEVFRCVGCEPGCGVLVALDQASSPPNSTVRLRTDAGAAPVAVGAGTGVTALAAGATSGSAGAGGGSGINAR